MIAEVRPSEFEDVETMLGIGLRSADLTEVRAMGSTPRRALRNGFRKSEAPYTLYLDEKPSAMFGVVPVPGGHGCIWLLGTADIESAKTYFLRHSREWLERISTGFTSVANIVHKENTLHIRWLRWLGFTFLSRRGPFQEFMRIV